MRHSIRKHLHAFTLALPLLAATAHAAEPPRAIEQALTTAQAERKGITLLVTGQQIGGAVTRIEPGQWVELRNAQHGRIVVRIDRIDAVLMP